MLAGKFGYTLQPMDINRKQSLPSSHTGTKHVTEDLLVKENTAAAEEVLVERATATLWRFCPCCYEVAARVCAPTSLSAQGGQTCGYEAF